MIHLILNFFHIKRKKKNHIPTKWILKQSEISSLLDYLGNI